MLFYLGKSYVISLAYENSKTLKLETLKILFSGFLTLWGDKLFKRFIAK